MEGVASDLERRFSGQRICLDDVYHAGLGGIGIKVSARWTRLWER